ncbi:MAG: DEAD/DEAH box helicase [Bacilli bacterium]
MNTSFTNLGLDSRVLNAIEALGYKSPSKIQEEIIPFIMDHNDVIGQAQTGTGKTLAYAASILSMIDVNTPGIKAIILTPTRELALQVSEEFSGLNKTKLKVLSVYGGSSIDTQLRALKHGVDIVVGTPGRVMDLIRKNALHLEDLDFFILDEADEMLNMGFQEDIEFIFEQTKEDKQVLLFSATMPKAIEKLAKKYMKKDYQHITIEETSKTSILVEQSYYLVNERVKIEALCRILDQKDPNLAIIFCKTKRDVDFLLNELVSRNYSVEAMHGDIAQNMRIQTLNRFKNKAFNYLIATDVAARGIHVDNIDLVINYTLPSELESYIHRIGRTGRASNKGEAISFATSREVRFIKEVEKYANCEINLKELPTLKDVFETKCQKILGKTSDVTKEEMEQFIPYVRDMPKDELIRFSASLLKLLLDKEIGSDFKKDITVSARNVHHSDTDDKNTTRVFLTLGKMDNITKKDLVEFLQEYSKVGRQHFQGIEMLPKFTFLNIDNDVVNEVIKKVDRKKLNNRVIHIDKAKRR